MKLYQVTSINIGSEVLVVKAPGPKEASITARDVVEENRMSDDDILHLTVTELVAPEKDGAGYCYPKASSEVYSYKIARTLQRKED